MHKINVPFQFIVLDVDALCKPNILAHKNSHKVYTISKTEGNWCLININKPNQINSYRKRANPTWCKLPFSSHVYVCVCARVCNSRRNWSENFGWTRHGELLVTKITRRWSERSTTTSVAEVEKMLPKRKFEERFLMDRYHWNRLFRG